MVYALVEIFLHSEFFTHAWTKSFGMNKRLSARPENEKKPRVRTKKLPFVPGLSVCASHQWLVVAIHQPKRKRSTCVVLHGCALFPEPILELVDFCFLSDFRIKQVLNL